MTNTKTHLEFLLRGAAGFAVDEVDSLGLKPQFDALLDQTISAIHEFPGIGLSLSYDDIFELARLYSSAFASPYLVRSEDLEGWYKRRHPTWYDGELLFYNHGQPLIREMKTAAAWWSLGVLEAINPIRWAKSSIEQWSKKWLHPISEAFATFENGLFGKLLG